jgi:hypothetical protein
VVFTRATALSTASLVARRKEGNHEERDGGEEGIEEWDGRAGVSKKIRSEGARQYVIVLQ